MLNGTVVCTLNLVASDINVIYVEDKPTETEHVIAKRQGMGFIVMDQNSQPIGSVLTTQLIKFALANLSDKEEGYFILEEVDYE